MSLVLSVAALAISAGSLTYTLVSLRRAGREQVEFTPDRVRAISSVKPGDVVVLTTDQHLNKVQANSLQEWAQKVEEEHGLKLIVIAGGLKPELVLRKPETIGELKVDIDASGIAEIMRKAIEEEIARAQRPAVGEGGGPVKTPLFSRFRIRSQE